MPFRAQVARRGWPVVERAVGVGADEWLRGFVSSMGGAAPTRLAVKTPVVSRETTGVLRRRDVSRETFGDHDLSLGSDYEADPHVVQHGEVIHVADAE